MGISPERLAEVYGGGIGISNVHERLRLLYGDQFKMDIRSEEGQGTQIHIEIPELVTTEHVLANRLGILLVPISLIESPAFAPNAAFASAAAILSRE